MGHVYIIRASNFQTCLVLLMYALIIRNYVSKSSTLLVLRLSELVIYFNELPLPLEKHVKKKTNVITD